MKWVPPLALALIAGAHAQSNIAPTAKHAHAANAGWIDFGDGQRRIDLLTGVFSGFAYSANLGWINLAASEPKADSLVRTDTDADGLSDAGKCSTSRTSPKSMP